MELVVLLEAHVAVRGVRPGSTDATPQIVAEFADEVLTFEWCDDFSAARNFSLAHIHTDWVYSWFDADMEMPRKSGRPLREAIRDPKAQALSLRLVHYDSDEPDWVMPVVWRHHPAAVYRYPCYGQIEWALQPLAKRFGREIVARDDITVVHDGFATPAHVERVRAKLPQERKRRAEDPDNPWLTLLLAVNLHAADHYDEALTYFTRWNAMRITDPAAVWDIWAAKGYAFHAQTLNHLGDAREAMRVIGLAMSAMGEHPLPVKARGEIGRPE